VILFVANGYPPTAYGGVEVYVSSVANLYARRGVPSTVICAERRSDSPDGQVIRDCVEGVSVLRVVNDFKRHMTFSSTYRNAEVEKLYSELLAEIGPTVVHFNHVIALSSALPRVTAQAGIPSVYTLHDFWPLCQRINLLDWRGRRCPGPLQGGDCHKCLARGTVPQQARTLLITALRSMLPFRVRAVLRDLVSSGRGAVPDLYPSPSALQERYEAFREAVLTAGRVLAPSQFVKDTFVRNGYPEDRIEVLPLGLDVEASSLCAHTKQHHGGTLRIAYVGSMVRIKGVHVLLRAFLQTKRARNLSLDLYGRLDVAPSYARYLRILAAPDARIRFRGPFVPEQRQRIYDGIDVLVVPSLAQETFSFVAREALLRGKAVIASSVGALPEVIRPGINGWLVAPGSVKELAEVLMQIADRPSVVGEMSGAVTTPTMSVREHVMRLDAIYSDARTGAEWGVMSDVALQV